MSWVFVDDGFDSDFRIEGLSLDATGLLVRGTSHSARHLLDGRLPKRWVGRRVPSAKKRARIVRELVAEGLWVERDDHYEIVPVVVGRDETLIGHDDRATVERRRDDERKRKSQQREAKRAENGSP